MIVVTRNFGQLGNRLMLSANLIAAAREYDVPFYNPSFAQYAHHFPATRGDLWCRYPRQTIPNQADHDVPLWQRKLLYHCVYLSSRTLSHLRLTRFPFHVIRLSGGRSCDLASDSFARKARSRRPLLVSGWGFTSKPLLAKHGDAIRDHFRIDVGHQENIRQLMHQARKNADFVIGIHIRQGDYATFRGGRYLYSVEQYVAAMKRLKAKFVGRSVAFVVCGNGQLKTSDFQGLNVHFGSGHLIEDMYSFAETDFLVGPPSTFTGWAAFMGQVPIRYLENVEDPFDGLPFEANAANAADAMAA